MVVFDNYCLYYYIAGGFKSCSVFGGKQYRRYITGRIQDLRERAHHSYIAEESSDKLVSGV